MDVLQVTQTRPACHVHVMPRQFHSKFQDLGSVLKPIAVKGKEQLHLGGTRVSKAPWWCFREAGAVLARWLMWSAQPAAPASLSLTSRWVWPALRHWSWVGAENIRQSGSWFPFLPASCLAPAVLLLFLAQGSWPLPRKAWRRALSALQYRILVSFRPGKVAASYSS